jgi:3-dehydrotetronate 4-kinase
MRVLLGCIADDFTGAGDVAGTIARLGLRTCVVVNRSAAPVGFDACVVALKTRSVPPTRAVAEALDAFEWLQAHRCDRFLFKYCSTFDSTPRGNIGPVADALAERLGARGVIVCPAYPANGRTVYQGHLFVHDRLLSESGMQHHPVTPMVDPDLRRWLGYQTCAGIGLIPLPMVRAGAGAIAEAVQASADRGETFVVVDAIADADLACIGEAVVGAPLITGGAAIAGGVVAALRQSSQYEPQQPVSRAVSGPGAVLAGSCSRATREQVQYYRQTRPSLALDAAQIVEGRVDLAAVYRFVFENLPAEPLCYTSGEPDEVAAIQRRYGAANTSVTLEQFFGRLAQTLIDGGVTRLVVAGGETSGAVVEALLPNVLEVGPEITPGVPVMMLRLGGRDRALVLKSGNFGGVDFLPRALRQMETGRAGS